MLFQKPFVPLTLSDYTHAWRCNYGGGGNNEPRIPDLRGIAHICINNNTAPGTVWGTPNAIRVDANVNPSTNFSSVLGASNFVGTNNFSLSIWVKRVAGLGGTFNYIFSHAATSGAADFGVRFHSDNKLYVDIPFVFDGVLTSTFAITDIINWHHVVVTRSGSTGSWNWALYIDGKLNTSISADAHNPTLTGKPYSIGCIVNGNRSQSLYRDVALWERALGAGEVSTLYAAQATAPSASWLPRIIRNLPFSGPSQNTGDFTAAATAPATFTARAGQSITAAAAAPATFTARVRGSITAAAEAAAAFTVRPSPSVTLAATATASFTAKVSTSFTLAAAASFLLNLDGQNQQAIQADASATAAFTARPRTAITAAAAAAASFGAKLKPSITAAATGAAAFTARPRGHVTMAATASAEFHGVFIVIIRPGTIASQEAVSTPNVCGPINPGTVPSAEAVGTPTLNVQQIVTPGTVLSAEVVSTPRVSHVITLTPGTIASAEAVGSPTLSQNQAPIFPGTIPSEEVVSAPDINGGTQALQVFVGNYDRSRWQFKPGGVSLRQQTLGRWSGTAIFQNCPCDEETGVVTLSALNTVDEFVPAFGMTILIKEFGRTLFRGCIRNVKTKRHPGTNFRVYTCELGDKGTLCEHRRVTRTYPAASEPDAVQWDMADVIRDIVASFMNGEGIGVAGIPATLGLLSAPIQAFVTVAQAFDQLRDLLGYAGWFVDLTQSLIFTEVSGVGDAPFELLEDGEEWRELEVEVTDQDYRNRQYVISNRKMVPESGGIAETYTLLRWGDRPNADIQPSIYPDNGGYQRRAFDEGFPPYYFFTKLGIDRIISAKLNGVAVTVRKSDEVTFDQWDEFRSGTERIWVYDGNGSSTIYFPSRFADPFTPLQAPGDVIEINYLPASTQTTVDENDVFSVEEPIEPLPGERFGTCGSGRYEHVEQVNDVFTHEAGQALATGLLARSSGIPKIVTYETDRPGLQVGQRQHADMPRDLLSDVDLFITELQGTSLEGTDLGFGSSFRWRVSASSRPDVGNWLKTWERLYRRTQHPTPVPRIAPTTIVLGPGRSIRTGEEMNPGKIDETGELIDVVAVFTNPPVDQDLVIDVRLDGVSIFSSAKLVIPANATGDIRPAAFAQTPLYAFKDQTITVHITYRVTGPNPVAARNGTVKLRWDV